MLLILVIRGKYSKHTEFRGMALVYCILLMPVPLMLLQKTANKLNIILAQNDNDSNYNDAGIMTLGKG